jgi:hypothetical protein
MRVKSNTFRAHCFGDLDLIVIRTASIHEKPAAQMGSRWGAKVAAKTLCPLSASNAASSETNASRADDRIAQAA